MNSCQRSVFRCGDQTTDWGGRLNGKTHRITLPFMPYIHYRQSAEPAVLAFPVYSFLTDEQLFPFSGLEWC